VKSLMTEASTISRRPSRGRAVHDPQALTSRQQELILYCVDRGYYLIPRRATLRELGMELGISAASLSLSLRRAEAKIISDHAKAARGQV